MVPVKFSRGTLLVGVCAPSLLAFLCPNALSLETFLFFVFFLVRVSALDTDRNDIRVGTLASELEWD